MSKFVLVTLCLFFTLLVVSSAAPSVTMKFVDDKVIKNSTAWVNLKFTGINMQYGLILTPDFKTSSENVPGAQLWSFVESTSNQLARIELLSGYQPDVCYDTKTKQAVAWIGVGDENEIHISGKTYPGNWNQNGFMSNLLAQAAETSETAVDSIQWDMNCPISINTLIIPTVFSLAVTAKDAGGTDIVDIPMTQLDLPTNNNNFVSPIINFIKASLKQESSDPYTSTLLSMEFTTDTTGVYLLSLFNGPGPDFSNYNDGTFGDLYCTSGSNKEFSRIIYTEGAIQIWVSTASPKNSIKCNILFGNAWNSNIFVTSQRVSAQLSFAGTTVSRGLDLKLVPAAAMTRVHSNYFQTTTTELISSATPLNNNSTIKFKFSKQIKITQFLFNEDGSSGPLPFVVESLSSSSTSQASTATMSILSTSYQRNLNCMDSNSNTGIKATSFIDINANTITLRDVLLIGNPRSLTCRWDFNNDQLPFDWKEGVNMGSVIITIDDKSLVSQLTPGNEIPIYLETVGNLDNDRTQSITKLSADGKSYEKVDVFTFVDQYNAYHTTMSNPVLVVGIRNAYQLFTMENYKDQIKCEATSPTRSAYEPLTLMWDAKFFTWTVKLPELVKIESYSILIKCTRTIPRLITFGIDVTPTARLSLTIVDLLDTKRFFSSYSATSNGLDIIQASEYNGEYPQPAVYNFCLKDYYYIPSLDKKDVDAAITLHTTQSKAYVDTVSTGWTVDNGSKPYYTYTWSSANNRGNIYLSTKASIDEFKLRNVNAHDVKSYEYNLLDEYERFSNSYGAQYYESRARYSTAPPMLEIQQCFNIIKGSTATGNIPTFSATSLNFYKPSLTADFTTTPISDYSYSTQNYNGYVSSSMVKGIGVENIYFFSSPWGTPQQPGYDYKEAGFSALLNQFNRGYYSYFVAQLGEKCTYNADCDDRACSNGVCTDIPTYNPPFVGVEVWGGSPKALDKDYFNSSSAFNLIAVIMTSVIAAMMF